MLTGGESLTLNADLESRRQGRCLYPNAKSLNPNGALDGDGTITSRALSGTL